MSVLVHVSVCVRVMYMCATACTADAVSLLQKAPCPGHAQHPSTGKLSLSSPGH